MSSSPSRWDRASNTASRSAAWRLLESIPIIDDTSDTHERSLDWPDATYEARATPAAGDLAWTVRHSLTGAPGIESLLRQGSAAWSVEARCAETLHASTETTTDPITTVSLSPQDVGTGTVHLWPGIVAIAECSLDPTGTLWGDKPLRLRPGRLLARAAPIRVDHEGSDPMLFIGDPNIEPETAVSIKVEHIGQDSRFVVRARPDRIDQLKYHEPALLACWSTALALLPSHSVFDIKENETGQAAVPESLIGDLILRRLQADRPQIALWDNTDEWDPLQAASAFVPLTPKLPENGDE